LRVYLINKGLLLEIRTGGTSKLGLEMAGLYTEQMEDFGSGGLSGVEFF